MGSNSSRSSSAKNDKNDKRATKKEQQEAMRSLRYSGNPNVAIFKNGVREGTPNFSQDIGGIVAFSRAIEEVYQEVKKQLEVAQRRHEDASGVPLWKVVKSRALFYAKVGDKARQKEQVLFCVEIAKESSTGRDLADAYAFAGRFFEEDGDYKEAEAHYRNAVDEIIRVVKKHNHPDVARYLRLLGDLYASRFGTRRLGEATAMYDQVLAIYNTGTQEFAEVAHSQFKCLAQMKGKQDKEQALFRGKQMIEVAVSNLGPSHKTVLGYIEEFNKWAEVSGNAKYIAV